MPTFLNKVFKRDHAGSSKKVEQSAPPPPQEVKHQDAWLRTEVAPEQVQELLRGCTQEIKSRGLTTIIPILISLNRILLLSQLQPRILLTSCLRVIYFRPVNTFFVATVSAKLGCQRRQNLYPKFLQSGNRAASRAPPPTRITID